MKTKKLLIASLFAAAMCFGTTAFADNKTASADKLPAEARSFVARNYPNRTIAYTSVDNEMFGTTYDVRLSDGTEIEFGKDGQWLEIKSSAESAIPSAVVPDAIERYVRANYPKTVIRNIERDKRDCEVTLSNGVVLTFDKNYKLIGMDD